MKATSTFKAGLQKLDHLWKPGQFGKALALVDRLLAEWPDNAHLLVKKAQLIQLQETEDGPSLEEARAMLERAADLDEECPVPAIELGYFLFAVEDDTRTALDWFNKAEDLLVRLLKECRKGKKAARAELAEDANANSTPVGAGQSRRHATEK